MAKFGNPRSKSTNITKPDCHLNTGEMCSIQEMSSCVTLCKLESHTNVYISLPSTIAARLVLRHEAALLHHDANRQLPALCLHPLQEDD
jgi:hypothetical protein